MKTCSICFGPIPPEGPNGTWKDGHNAQPVNDGRCCGDCNTTVVIPARMRRMGLRQTFPRKPKEVSHPK